jgi:Holliday junction resolvasome RuvABC endonuclease subunit
MNQQRILALDPGHALGYAVDGSEPGELVTGVCDLPRGGQDRGKTYSYFATWLEMTVNQYGVTVLAWEAPIIFGGKKGSTMKTNAATIEFAFGLAAIAEMVGHRLGLICWKAPLGTVRLHFTGNGKADKGQVYARCLALGYDVTSLDAADAAAIWDFIGHMYRRRDLVAGPLFTPPGKARSMRRAAPEIDAEL